MAASRLGYRMTEIFAAKYFGRIFLHPHAVFTPEMLRPEVQDEAVFAESMATIVSDPRARGCGLLRRRDVELAVPPLRALLEIMARGASAEGWALDSPEFRAQFTRQAVLDAPWYAARLEAKQAAASDRADAGLAAIEKFVSTPGNEEPTARLGMPQRVAAARAEAERFRSAEFRERIVGTVGGTPI